MPNSSFCLLLTATIDVAGISEMARNDTSLRLSDYETALRMWLESGFARKIVFVENSGFDLSSLRHIVAEYHGQSVEVEFLSFWGQDFPRAFGKGYGEMIALKYADHHSQFLRESLHFLKVNGRYFLANGRVLISGIVSTPNRSIVCDLCDNLRWADSRAFGGTTEFLQSKLLPLAEQVDDSAGNHFEYVLAKATHHAISEGWSWRMPLAPPEILGVYGTGNTAYSTSLLRKTLKRSFQWMKRMAIQRRQMF